MRTLMSKTRRASRADKNSSEFAGGSRGTQVRHTFFAGKKYRRARRRHCRLEGGRPESRQLEQVSLDTLWGALSSSLPAIPVSVSVEMIAPRAKERAIFCPYDCTLQALKSLLRFVAASAQPQGRVSVWMEPCGDGRVCTGIASTGNAPSPGPAYHGSGLETLEKQAASDYVPLPYGAQYLIESLGGELLVRFYGAWGFSVYVFLPRISRRLPVV